MQHIATVLLVLVCYTPTCLSINPVSHAISLNNAFIAIGHKNTLNYVSKSYSLSRKVSTFLPSYGSTLGIFKGSGEVSEKGKNEFKSTVNALHALDGAAGYTANERSAWPQWTDHCHKLTADIKAAYTYITDMKLYHSDSQYHDAARRFRGQYESRLPSIRQFYHMIVNKQPFLGYQTFFTAAAQEFNFDLDKVQSFMSVSMEYLVMGSIVETTDLAFKGMLDGRDYNDDIVSIATRWDDWMKEVNKEIDVAVELVKSRFPDMLKEDMNQILAAKRHMSNQHFVSELYHQLKDKYFWRDFFALAYNPITGGSVHWVGQKGGHIMFRHYGRNIMVASLENDYKPHCSQSYKSFMKSAGLNCKNKDSSRWFKNFTKWSYYNHLGALAFVEYGKHNVWYISSDTEYHQTCNQNVMIWPSCKA